jgi:hypothetical protein
MTKEVAVWIAILAALIILMNTVLWPYWIRNKHFGGGRYDRHE